MAKTKIEWADEVWNPVTGCSKVSQGCKHCYAETIAKRFWAEQYPLNDDGSSRKFTDVRCHLERLKTPLKWRKPRRVFVNSMSDLFHEDVPGWFQRNVFDVMQATPQHTYMVLTKRPARMFSWTINYQNPPLQNVWLGVSVEDQKTADERIPVLLQTPAAVRFVSYEPALGPVDFMGAFCGYQPPLWGFGPDIHQIIMGVESGRDARMLPDQDNVIRSTRDQCINNGVKFFLKQMYVNGKLVKMPELDGKVWDEFPAVQP